MGQKALRIARPGIAGPACRAALARLACMAALAGLACMAALAGPLAGEARANGYHVYSCRTPWGAPAPADGWSGSVAPGGTYDQYALNTCPSGGSLIAALGDVTKHAAFVDEAVWTFTAPPGETITGANLWRAGDNAGGGAGDATYQFWFAGPTDSRLFAECVYIAGCRGLGVFGQPFAPTNLVAVPGANLGSHLYLIASCGGVSGNYCEPGKGDANGYAAAVYLYGADLLLEQSAGPAASNVGGPLAVAPTVQGTTDLTFTATDPGAGVYQAVFAIDGRPVQDTVIDENNGRCHDVGGTGDGRPAFLYVQPCKPSVSADVPFDTTRAPNGVHQLVVTVTDPAGNTAPVLDRQIAIANPPPPGAPNGTNASAQASLAAHWIVRSRGGARSRTSRRASTRLTSPYGRPHRIAARLTAPGGAPIAGARIDCTALPAYAGARPIAIPCPPTGPDGRFAVEIPRGAGSRTIELAYRAHLGDAQPAAARRLSLTVRAGLRLRVSPSTSGVGQTIRFTGRLLGTPIPRGGKQLVLEARSPGGPWIEFDSLKTNRRGRYRDSYTFKFPGPVTYTFRALSESEADFPFAAGTSNVVRVHER